jgi:hypothetical protein
MPCSRFTAMRRLISLYLEKVDQKGSEDALLGDLLDHYIIELVAQRDLFARYDDRAHLDRLSRYGWDEHRARELLRQWLRERPASSRRKEGQQ